MNAVARRRCRPAVGEPVAGAELARLLTEVPNWSVVDGALSRQFSFNDYARMIGFVNAVAWLAQLEDHHPDIHIAWGRCTVRWRTHSVGGLSINDFICAAQVDALAP